MKKNYPDAEKEVVNILLLDDERKQLQTKLDNYLRESNESAKKIAGLLQEGKKEEVEQIKKRSVELKTYSKETEIQLSDIEQILQDALVKLPNIPHKTVQNGNSAEDNVIVIETKNIKVLPENALPHWDLAKQFDIVDFELGNKITGAGFPVYKGKGAKLQRALINFFLDEAEKMGYNETQVPILINKDSGFGTGQLPDKEGQMYFTGEDNLYLIPTAEVPLTNIYRDVILKMNDLPVKMVGYTPCFRREAGSYGKHVRGLNRLHQFDKVEIVQIESPEKSYDTLISMRDYVQSLIEKLGLPFRILRLCGGDMGFASALTYDFEVYSGAQKTWLEVSSVSNFETFQSNRLKLRYKDANGKSIHPHTLNGSALALPRILAAILENYQEVDKKGVVKINIPDVLIKYTGFDFI